MSRRARASGLPSISEPRTTCRSWPKRIERRPEIAAAGTGGKATTGGRMTGGRDVAAGLLLGAALSHRPRVDQDLAAVAVHETPPHLQDVVPTFGQQLDDRGHRVVVRELGEPLLDRMGRQGGHVAGEVA